MLRRIAGKSDYKMFIVFAFIISAILIFHGSLKFHDIYKYRKYVPVSAKFYKSEIFSKKENQVFVVVEVFYPKFNYVYQCNGIQLEGNSESANRYHKFSSEVSARHFIKNIEQTKTVYFNPKNPNDSIYFRPSLWWTLNRTGSLHAGLIVLMLLVARNMLFGL